MATATVILTDKKYSEVVDSCKNRGSSVIYEDPFEISVMYSIPFKIRVTNITIPGYTPSNVPPIGIAIIGFNNYIL